MWFQGLIWEVLNVILGFGLSCGTLTKRGEKKLMLYYSLELLCDRLTCGPHNSSMLRKGSMTMTLFV